MSEQTSKAEVLTHIDGDEILIGLVAADDGLPVDRVDVAEVRVLLDLDRAPQDVGQAGQTNFLHAFHLSYDERIVLKKYQIVNDE